MCALTKFICLFLPLLLLSSCSNSEEPDYPTVASSIFNDVLIDVLDSEGNSLIDNEAIMNGLSFIGNRRREINNDYFPSSYGIFNELF